MVRMNITVFGANGAVGQVVVKYALSEGHTVKAFVHEHNDLPYHPHLTIIKGDVYDHDAVSQAVNGVDAVVSVLSSWGTGKEVLSDALERIIPAMKEHSVSRIVTLTGAEARARGDQLSLLHKILHGVLGIVGGSVLRDGEKHIAQLEASGLDWVVIRSPVMTSRTHEAHRFTQSRPLPWTTVSRHAVANAIIDQLTNDHHSQQAPFIR